MENNTENKFLINPAQRKKLRIYKYIYIIAAVSFLCYCTFDLISDKMAENGYWDSAMTTSSDVAKEAAALDGSAEKVQVGTHIGDIKNFNIEDSAFTVSGSVWFKWTGDPDLDMAHHFSIYKGTIKDSKVSQEIHDGNTNYQLVDFEATISKEFWTKRFPLESHQIRMYIMSDYPVDDVVFTDDKANSKVADNLSVTGFKTLRSATDTLFYKLDTSYGEPGIKDKVIVSEHVTQIEISRSSVGLYLICFISLFGTVIWALISLYICTYHRVDPLSLLPGALFGAAANVIVGANRVANIQSGLLLYVNILGISTILIVSLLIIVINRIRAHYEDREYAAYFGKVMFRWVALFTIVGNILLPVSSYMFR